MGATGTNHHKPENIRRLEGAELPAYITPDGQHVIVKLGQTWKVLQRTAGVFATRRAAAEYVADLDRVIASPAVVEQVCSAGPCSTLRALHPLPGKEHSYEQGIRQGAQAHRI